jgi:hypothetical protein
MTNAGIFILMLGVLAIMLRLNELNESMTAFIAASVCQ